MDFPLQQEERVPGFMLDINAAGNNKDKMKKLMELYISYSSLRAMYIIPYNILHFDKKKLELFEKHVCWLIGCTHINPSENTL